MLRMGILRALLALVLGCVLASSADARKWRRTISPEGVEVGTGAGSGGGGARQPERVGGGAPRGPGRHNMPLDDIARVADPNELQRRALQALRDAAKEAAERLASDCPQQVPAALSARLEAVEQGIDVALAAFATVQPAMQSFYGALDDEQKARLQRDVIMNAAPARSAERPRERADQRSDQRRERRRGAAGRTKPDDRLDGASRIAAPKLVVGACEGFAAALRGWPIREIERSVQLSEQQRVAFYEFVTASLKTAGTLVTACPAATAITPARRMEVMVARLAAVRAAIAAIQPALTRFYEALDQGQKMRFAGMS